MKEIKPVIEAIRAELKKIQIDREELGKIINSKKTSIMELQAMCKHNWVIVGHDSHHNHAECTYCKKEDYYA